MTNTNKKKRSGCNKIKRKRLKRPVRTKFQSSHPNLLFTQSRCLCIHVLILLSSDAVTPTCLPVPLLSVLPPDPLPLTHLLILSPFAHQHWYTHQAASTYSLPDLVFVQSFLAPLRSVLCLCFDPDCVFLDLASVFFSYFFSFCLSLTLCTLFACMDFCIPCSVPK